MQRFKAWWTTERIFDLVLVLAVIFITVWELHPNLIFSNTLITGGDTGSHLAAPAYLRTTGNPFDFTPWDPGWFDGFPLYTYYFVLPDVIATFASYIIGFAVAIKLATILGLGALADHGLRDGSTVSRASSHPRRAGAGDAALPL